MKNSLSALVAASIIFVPGAILPTEVQSRALNSIVAGADGLSFSLETLRVRDRDILMTLAESLQRRHGPVLEGSEAVLTKVRDGDMIYYRLDFVGLGSEEAARRICAVLDMDRCFVIDSRGSARILSVSRGTTAVSAVFAPPDREPFGFSGEMGSSDIVKLVEDSFRDSLPRDGVAGRLGLGYGAMPRPAKRPKPARPKSEIFSDDVFVGSPVVEGDALVGGEDLPDEKPEETAITGSGDGLAVEGGMSDRVLDIIGDAGDADGELDVLDYYEVEPGGVIPAGRPAENSGKGPARKDAASGAPGNPGIEEEFDRPSPVGDVMNAEAGENGPRDEAPTDGGHGTASKDDPVGSMPTGEGVTDHPDERADGVSGPREDALMTLPGRRPGFAMASLNEMQRKIEIRKSEVFPFSSGPIGSGRSVDLAMAPDAVPEGGGGEGSPLARPRTSRTSVTGPGPGAAAITLPGIGKIEISNQGGFSRSRDGSGTDSGTPRDGDASQTAASRIPRPENGEDGTPGKNADLPLAAGLGSPWSGEFEGHFAPGITLDRIVSGEIDAGAANPLDGDRAAPVSADWLEAMDRTMSEGPAASAGTGEGIPVNIPGPLDLSPEIDGNVVSSMGIDFRSARQAGRSTDSGVKPADGVGPVGSLRVRVEKPKVDVARLGAVVLDDTYAIPVEVMDGFGEEVLQKLPLMRPDPPGADDVRMALAGHDTEQTSVLEQIGSARFSRDGVDIAQAPGVVPATRDVTRENTSSLIDEIFGGADEADVPEVPSISQAAPSAVNTPPSVTPPMASQAAPVIDTGSPAPAAPPLSSGGLSMGGTRENASALDRALDEEPVQSATEVKESGDSLLRALMKATRDAGEDAFVRPAAAGSAGPEAAPVAGSLRMEEKEPGLMDRAGPSQQRNKEFVTNPEMRIELSYVSERDDVAGRVAELKEFIPPVLLRKGRFFGAALASAPGIFIIGIEASDASAREDLVWYFERMEIPFAFRR